MRRYETFVIIDPDLSQEQRDSLTGRVETLISQLDGFLVLKDEWGERKLAYDIKKKGRGYYVRFDYCGLPALVNEIERFFRIDERALKFMTVVLNKEADLKTIKAEKAAAEKAAEEKMTAESLPEPEAAPEPDQTTELAPEEEGAKTDAKTDDDAPSSESEDVAAEEIPSATKKEEA